MKSFKNINEDDTYDHAMSDMNQGNGTSKYYETELWYGICKFLWSYYTTNFDIFGFEKHMTSSLSNKSSTLITLTKIYY